MGAQDHRAHRKSERVPVLGCASVHWRGGERRRYTLDNVSTGGALMLGMPMPRVGEQVLAVLRVSGARPVSVSGKVIRVNHDSDTRPAFAVQFAAPSSDLEELVREVADELDNDRLAHTVLVVARSVTLREQLSCWLTGAGWRVIGVATPLEAVAELDRRPGEVRWVVALDRLTQTGGTELLSYVSSAYPGVHRLLVSPESEHQRCRDAMNDGVADAALAQPIGMKRLAEALGRAPRRDIP